MQRHTLQPDPIPPRGAKFGPVYPAVAAVAFAGLIGLAAGCNGGTGTAGSQSGGKPFAGAAVTVACDDPAFARELSGRCAAWAARTGATARVESRPPADVPTADVAVVRPPELGAFAAREELAPLPAPLRSPENPLQWPRIVPVFRNTLCGWAGEVEALPLAGDGYVLAYRADRFAGFAQASGRPLAAPATWEDVAEVAAAFHKADGKPSLPPLPADPRRLLAEFHQLVTCYDRKASADADRPTDPRAATEGLSLHFKAGSWEPRLEAPAFAAAADWFNQVQKLRPAAGSDDPVRALDQGSAVVAVLSLAEVGRLPRDAAGEVDKRFQVAPLPGTRTYFDPAGKRTPAGRQANYVPFLGFGGRVGVVFKRSPSADAAWDLLADLAAPAASVARLSNPEVGAGPFRAEHADAAQDDLWLPYRFDTARNRELAGAVRHYLGLNVVNPALALRTPDQGPLMAALEAEVRRAATGQATGAEAMKRAAEAWAKHDAGHDRPTNLR